MKVSLVSITKPMLDIESSEAASLSSEELIAYTARVSNPANQVHTASSFRLLAYLIKHKHWSPFEMVDMTVEIVTSRAIAQQILRHRSFSFQEFSQRYAEVVDIEPIELRKQGEKNRQGGEEIIGEHECISMPVYNLATGEIKNTGLINAYEAIRKHTEHSKALYRNLIVAGVAKESARFVLPLATQTRLYMKGSVRSWIHYLQLRLDSHAQKEHREVAIEIEKIFSENFPNISKLIKENNNE